VHQTLSNLASFALSPYLYTGGCEKGLATERKGGSQFASDWEEDATFVPTWVGGSWMAIMDA